MSKKTYRPPLTISRRDYLRDGSDALFRQSIYSMTESTAALLTFRDAFGRALGMTASQFAVLMGVAYRQGRDGVTVKDLANHVSLAATHVTTDVGRLERKGILLKMPSPVDKRSVLVSLTPLGEQAIAEVAPLVRAVNDLLFQGIAPDHLEIAHKVARALILNAEYALAELRRREKASNALDIVIE